MVNAIDDIFIMGATESELEERFREVLTRLRDQNLTVKTRKCKFNEQEITFFDFKLSSDGASLSNQKTLALKEFKTPNTGSELHSFLALANYASRWIPKFAVLAAELWDLTKKDAKWEWDESKQLKLDVIKTSLIEKVGFFDLKWHTAVTTDASGAGLAAVLTQSNPEDPSEVRIITHISRKLADTETRYSQIEKEALACVWACTF